MIAFVFNVVRNQPLPEFKDNGRFAAQYQIVQKIGINSTPRYWINGHYFAGTQLQDFEKLLDSK